MKENAHQNILVLDDEEIIRYALKETLQLEGYKVILAATPQEALDILSQESFGVIISDQRMPVMTGLEFFEHAKKRQPDASRILITGVLTLKTVIDSINRGEIFRFVAKPWIREELLATVKNAVNRFRLIQINKKLQADTLKLNDDLSQANQKLNDGIEELIQQKKKLDAANSALRENFEHSLELCYRIISTFHPGLGKETKAIVEICRMMIEAGNFTDEEAHILLTAARLQNLGLVGIPRETIVRARKNPHTLSENERTLIHNHTIYGQTLASFVDDLATVGQTIRSSHERWDGQGYPDGLAREAIPKMGRYLAVAVHYVECGTSQHKAVESIIDQSGYAFEPEAVRLFLKATHLVNLPQKVTEVLLSELVSGMILAKGIYSPTGLLLVPEGSEINDPTLRKLRDHDLVDPITQRLLVYN